MADNKIDRTWTQFKLLIDSHELQWQYDDDDSVYNLIGIQGPIIFTCSLTKDGGSYHQDFEDNYKNNQTPTFRMATKMDSISAKQEGDWTVESVYTPKIRIDFLTTPISISNNGTYTTIYEYIGTGLFVGFNLEFNGNSVEVKFEVDGQEVFSGQTLSQLNAFIITTSTNSSRQSGQGLLTDRNNMDFSLNRPIKFLSNIKISAKIDSGQSKKFNQGAVYIQKDT